MRHLLLIAPFLCSLDRAYLKLRERFACESREFHPAVIPGILGFDQPTALTSGFGKYSLEGKFTLCHQKCRVRVAAALYLALEIEAF